MRTPRRPLPDTLRPRTTKSVEEASTRIAETFRIQTALLSKDELEGLAMLRTILDETTRVVVDARRAKGDSWAAIGRSLGVTKQAAQRRYRKV